MARIRPGGVSKKQQSATYVAQATTAATAGTTVETTQVTGDANPRFKVTADGTLAWGNGTNAPDATLSRIVESSVVELQSSKPFVPASYVKVTGDPGNNTAIYEALANLGGYARLALLEAGSGTVLVTKPSGAEAIEIWDGTTAAYVARIDAGTSAAAVRLRVQAPAGQTGDLIEAQTSGSSTFKVDSSGSVIVDDGNTHTFRLVAVGAIFWQHNSDISFTDINSGAARAVIGTDGHLGIQKNNTGANLYSGTGAPAVGTGSNGDYYLRTDTPGTANQRLYVKSAGAWAGIV